MEPIGKAQMQFTKSNCINHKVEYGRASLKLKDNRLIISHSTSSVDQSTYEHFNTYLNVKNNLKLRETLLIKVNFLSWTCWECVAHITLHHFWIACGYVFPTNIFSNLRNTIIKIRVLTLTHHYHLILSSHLSFTNFPNNVLYRKGIQFRMKHTLPSVSGFLQFGKDPGNFFVSHDLNNS